MPQLLSMVQMFAFALVLLGMAAFVYFLSRIKPIGRFFATLVHIPGIALRSLASFLKPFDVEQKSTTNRYPGLRTIVLNVAAGFAIVATVADGFLTLQALQALTDDTSINLTLPASLSWLVVSQGWLLLSIPTITGMILLDTYFQVVPIEARIFDVPADPTAKKRFERFILITFMLSLVASITFNALKPSYMLDTESIITWVLRIVVFVVLGSLLPLVMALTLYILSAALHSLVFLVLAILALLASMLARIAVFLGAVFTQDDVFGKDTFSVTRIAGGVVVKEADNPLAPDLLPDAGSDTSSSTPLLADQPTIPSLTGLAVHGAEPDTEPLPILAGKETAVKPAKPEKPKKQKRAGISRWFIGKEFLPFEAVQPGQDQSNGKPIEEKPVKKAASTRKAKSPAPVPALTEQPGVNGNVKAESTTSKPRARRATASKSKPAAVRRGGRKKASAK